MAVYQHGRNGRSKLELLAYQVCDGGGHEVGVEISIEDRLWSSLWYPRVSRLIISKNIQVMFRIVVDDVLIEKCSLKLKCLISNQNP